MPDAASRECDFFAESLQSVLETMVFMITDELEDDELDTGAQDMLRAEMQFSGAHSGKAVLAAQSDLCAEIAENMLGIDEEDLNESSLEDALREILNMTCGQYLTSRWGEEEVFDLTVPNVVKIDAGQWSELAEDEQSVVIDAEGFQMVAAVYL
jgi:chemotaxis protein CheY-P-specific phosphatase CheC